MADRHDIISLPNKHLRQPSKKVGFVNDKVKKVINDMAEATLDWEEHRKHEFGVALAAIQIDQPLRIVVVRRNLDDKSDRSFDVFINPVIVKKMGEPELMYEGCLSVKDIYGHVPRYPKVKVKATDENGSEVRVTAEGFLAQVFQHEIDHLKGILFVDHIKDHDVFYEIQDDGKLKKLDHEQVTQDPILW